MAYVMTENESENPIDTDTSGLVGAVTAPLRDFSKPAGKVLAKLVGATGDGAINMFGDIYGGLIGDRLHQWRMRNWIDVVEKTARHFEAKGIDLDHIHALPDGELYAIFSGESKADDPDLRHKWAKLLSAAMHGDEEGTEILRFAATLEQLNGSEVRLLDFLAAAPSWLIRFKELHDLTNPFEDDEKSRQAASLLEDHKTRLESDYKVALGDLASDDLRPVYHLQQIGCVTRDVELSDASGILEDYDPHGLNDQFPSDLCVVKKR